jgi:nucleotide-binding universal stress UspA family protein
MSTPFQRILVPVDFARATDQMIADGTALEIGEDLHIDVSPASARSIEIATGLCADGGEVRLLHATPALEQGSIYGGASGLGGLSTAIDEIHANAHKAAIQCLERLAADYRSDRITVSCHATHGVALKVVLETAKAFPADLIVLAASGRSRVARFFLGSTADRIIRESECPVLVLPTARE